MRITSNLVYFKDHPPTDPPGGPPEGDSAQEAEIVPEAPASSTEIAVLSDDIGNVNRDFSNLTDALPRQAAVDLDPNAGFGTAEETCVIPSNSSDDPHSFLRRAAEKTGEGSSRSTAVLSSLDTDTARNRNTVTYDSTVLGEMEMIYQLLTPEAETRNSPIDSTMLRQTAQWIHKESCFRWSNFKHIYSGYGKDRFERHHVLRHSLQQEAKLTFGSHFVAFLVCSLM